MRHRLETFSAGRRSPRLVLPVMLALAATSRAGDDGDPLARALELEAQVDSLYGEDRYAEALGPARESLAIREKALDKDDPLVADSLYNLASVLCQLGAYTEARPLHERALAIREKALGKDHPDVAACLHSLASLLHDQGAYAEARPLYERALAIYEKACGKDSPEVAMELNNLALLFQAQGSYAEARPLLERTLAIDEKACGKDGPDVATDLNNLAVLLQAQGSYAEARPLLERALAIDEKARGKDDPEVATDLNNLGVLLRAQGSYAEARPLLERALAIRERALPKEHPLVAASLHNLAELLRVQGSCAEARPLSERALAIWERSLGKNHPDVATGLNSLALALQAEGSYAEARPLFERALAIWEEALGDRDRRVAEGLGSLAMLLDAQGLVSEARPVHERALAVAERSLRGSLGGLSSTERVDFSFLFRRYLDHWLAFAARAGLSGYPEVLRFKGLIARASAAERALMRSAGPDTRKAVDDLRAAEATLSRLANAMPPAVQAEEQKEWRTRYARAAAERERLSLALSSGLAPYRRGLERLDLRLADIQAQLGGGDALVDVLRSGGRYLAWVVGHEGDAARLDLGKAEEIESAAEAFVDATRRADSASDAAWQEAGRRLRALVWEPVASKLPKDVTTVYVSPDAALAAVPLEALPGKEPGRFLIDDTGIVLLSMAQDLVPWPSRPAGRGALVVGGVDFGKAGAETADPPVTVLARATDRASRGSDFGPLPATADEAAGIGARFGGDALVLVGTDATEARLRREAPGRRILHLATHGFVREDLMRGLRGANEETVSDAALGRHLAAGHDPMLLSGLAMAGANPRDGGCGDDGILTALEASTLDLEACDLVVLSACDTARGTAESGEGVLGLVTGFRIAGARCVIGSLWKVDDEATRLLMGRLYDGILRKEKPLSPAESLREAALWLRTQKGAGGQPFDAPRYWTAFVAYGR